MRLTRWSPFFARDPFEDFDKIFEGFPRTPASFTPEVDVYEVDDDVVVEMPLAGVDPDKVEISVEDDDLLMVKGTMEKKTEVEDRDYARREVRRGSFHRAVRLPVPVAGEKASAESENGMLKIAMPKKTPETGKSIKVDVKKN